MLTQWLALRGSLLGRLSLDSEGTASTTSRPYGIIASVGATGQF